MAISSSQPTSGWNTATAGRSGPAAGLAYAGFWVRVAALMVDGLVLAVLSIALAPGAFAFVQTGPNWYELNHGSSAVGALIGLVYFIGFWAWRGQTPGMIAFTLRVVRAEDGGHVDVIRSLLRYVGLIISFAVILIGVIWVAFDGRKQGWHDKLGGTVVVRSTPEATQLS
jgi:uncharacterized RDD family membrane protein YckC